MLSNGAGDEIEEGKTSPKRQQTSTSAVPDTGERNGSNGKPRNSRGASKLYPASKQGAVYF